MDAWPLDSRLGRRYVRRQCVHGDIQFEAVQLSMVSLRYCEVQQCATIDPPITSSSRRSAGCSTFPTTWRSSTAPTCRRCRRRRLRRGGGGGGGESGRGRGAPPSL